jgi:hypothetical protein
LGVVSKKLFNWEYYGICKRSEISWRS